MKQDVLKKAAAYHKEHRQKARRYKVLGVLASVVVFCTTVALIMPAATMNRDPVCELEQHIHSDECYGDVEVRELLCPEADHEHGDECYQMVTVTGRELVCDEDHEHGEECWAETAVTDRELACELAEGHVHGEECWAEAAEAEEQEPVCGIDAGHEHGDACYEVTAETTRTLTCEELEDHVHDENCYETVIEVVGHELLCTDEGHEHDDSCYKDITESTEKLICSEEGGHKHVGTCYTYATEETKTLVCEAEEGHEHSEACFPEVEAQEPVLVCELEENHTHGDECYHDVAVQTRVLACTAHVHEDGCYHITMETGLICGLEEHEHTDECYQTEDEEHVHTEDCYAEVTTLELTCGLEENEEHTHDDSCYTETTTLELICGEGEDGEEPSREIEDGDASEAHVHTDECYAEITALELTCGLEENEEHTHEDSCYTEITTLELICGMEETKGGETGEDDGDTELVLAKTVYGGFYRAEFQVVYLGELNEDDELRFTANTIESADDESDRAYEYMSLITNEYTMPAGRTEFELTLNGEIVDRDLYYVTANITPSREAIAYLAQIEMGAQADMMDMMMLEGEDFEDLEDLDDCCETGPVPAIVVNQLGDGELVTMGGRTVDFTDFDLESYMAALDDYPGADFYDSDYSFSVDLTDNDFAVMAQVTQETVNTLATVEQKWWHDDLVAYWDGYTTDMSGTKFVWDVDPERIENYADHVFNCYDGIDCKHGHYEPAERSTHIEPDHVQKVTLTPSDSNGRIEGLPATVKEGTADTASDSGLVSNGVYTDGLYLRNVYESATAGVEGLNNEFTEDASYKNIATAVRLTLKRGLSSGTKTIIYSTDSQFQSALGAKVGDSWTYNRNEYTITKIEYKVTIPAVAPVVDYALLEITPDPGYYVKELVIACDNGNSYTPFGCTVWADYRSGKEGLFAAEFGVSDGTKVSLTVPSYAFCHGSDADSLNDIYYILIRTAPIPSPLFVSYDPGVIGDTGLTNDSFFTAGNDWLDGTGRNTVAGNNVTNATTVDQLEKKNGGEWSTGELDYYVSGISAEAEARANAQGYRFTGWRLEYWGDVEKGLEDAYTNTDDIQAIGGTFPVFDQNNHQNNLDHGYSGSLSIPKNELSKSHNLMTNAKLIAQWERIPAAEVNKTVSNFESDAQTEQTFNFTIKRTDGANFSFTGVEPQYTVVNGVYIASTMEKNISSVNGVAEFQVTVLNNGSRNYVFKGLPDGEYEVAEVVPDGAKYRMTSSDTKFTVSNTSATITAAHTARFVNDFTDGYDLTLNKVMGNTTADGTQIDINTPEQTLAALNGATFKLFKGNEETELGTLSPNKTNIDPTAPASATTEVKLDYNTVYRLEESEAPAGYNKLAHPIYFKATSEGLVLCDANGDEANYTNAMVDADAETLTLIIANYGGYQLPSTGGPGTAYLYALGGVLLMTAAAILVYKKRREGGMN